MATYATITEARDQYGENYVAVSGDREGSSEASSIEESLENASGRIDGYAEAYYPDGLPATAAEAPSWWKMCCIDIAIYFASANAGPRTEEKRKRYEDAIALLEYRYPAPEATETTAPSSSVGASISAEDRVFTREKMSELL